MKKSKILALIPQNLVIYHTRNLCHCIKNTLFYLWLKYEAIWTNIVSPKHWILFDKFVQWDMAPKLSFRTFKDMF
jgi:hypothetical protein